MRLPRLHAITDDTVLRDVAFADRAELVLAALGPDVALHLRGHGTPAATLYALGERLAGAALRTGAQLFINDRVDIALAVRATGVQLGVRGIPVTDARALLGAGARIGFSAHHAARAVEAVVDGADFVVVGTIFASASHPDEPGAGVELLQDAARRAGAPVLGIGGFSPGRAAAAAAAGAWGIAVLGGIWHAPDAAAAAREYGAAIRAAWLGAEEKQAI